MTFFATVSLVFGIIGLLGSLFAGSIDPVFFIYGLLAQFLVAPAFLVASLLAWANARRPDRAGAHRLIAALFVLAFVARFIMALDLSFTPVPIADPGAGSPLGFAPYVAIGLTWAATTVIWFLVFGRRMARFVRSLVAFLCAAVSTLVLAILSGSPLAIPLAAIAALLLDIYERRRRAKAGTA